ADQAHVAVEYRQAPLIQPGHVGRDFIDILVFEAVLHLRRHHLAHRAVRAAAFADAAQDHVAVGHHPHQAVVLAHGEAADVALGHPARGVLHRGGRGDDADIAAHHVADTHGAAPAWNGLPSSATAD